MRFGKVDNGYAVTLVGNGPLLAAKVEEAKDLPARVFLDFHGVAAGSAPAVTPVNADDIERVRVATNSREPLITRVVIDLARKIPYTIETVGEEMRVLFKAPLNRRRVATPRRLPRPRNRTASRRETGMVEAGCRALSDAAPLRHAVQLAATRCPSAPLPSRLLCPARSRRLPPVSPAPLPVPMPASVIAAAQRSSRRQCAAADAEQRTGQRLFTGDPITLDFQGADLRAVLRTFAEISRA